jgi:ribonucleoside-diphosphate reductase alpha chain
MNNDVTIKNSKKENDPKLSNTTPQFTMQEVKDASMKYFNDDDLAATVFVSKYALRDNNILSTNDSDEPKQFVELTPDGMHDRLAYEFAKKDLNYPNPVSFDTFRNSLDKFQYIVPQGSPMYGVGNPFVNVSISNCLVVDYPKDSISGIMDSGKELANLMKRRAGVGISLDTLRPDRTPVSNSAGTSTGAWSFANYFSDVCRTIGQCLAGDTEVLTPNGLTPINNIKTGDEVWTARGFVPVMQVLKNYKPLVELETESGKKIRCSADHVFDSVDGERPIRDFKPGDSINTVIGEGWDGQDIFFKIPEDELNCAGQLNTNITLPTQLTKEFAYILGLMYGNGHTDHKNVITVEFSESHPSILSKYIELVKRVFNYEIHPEKKRGEYSIGCIDSTLLTNFLIQNNILEQKAGKLILPSWINIARPEMVLAFMSGYFDADGCVKESKKIFTIDSADISTISKFQKILMAFGIVANITTQDISDKNSNNTHQLNINGQRSQINFKNLLTESVKVQGADFVENNPKTRDFTSAAKDFGARAEKHSHAKQSATSSAVLCLEEDVNLKLNLRKIQDYVVSVTELGVEEETYDLVLPTEHLFFANGLYAHNSGRRGALMITLNVLHPDIPKFITMKHDITKVTGANISVMLTDDFMNAVENDEEWICRWPIDANLDEIYKNGGTWTEMPQNISQGSPITYKKWVPDKHTKSYSVTSYRAKDIWTLINESAVKSAEPGLIFIDNYCKNLPADYYPGFKSVCVNPCSEILLSKYDSCRLTSMNLYGFVKNPFTPEAYFDYNLFKEQVRIGMRIMDDIVDLEIDYLRNIVNSCDDASEISLWEMVLSAAINGRRTGLGAHALADTLAALNMRYDSDEALNEISEISKTLCVTAYDASVDLAIERGAFPIFNWETEKDCDFIKRLPEWLQEKIAKHGRRNISVLTIAPTGSVSIVSQTSSGLEPVFSNFYTRRRKINPSDSGSRVDFTDQNGDKWQEYPVFHQNVQRYLNITGRMEEWNKIESSLPVKDWAKALTEMLPESFVTAPEIDAKRRVEIQGCIQKWIDHGISSTINLPKGTTVEQGQELYMLAWKHGLKGVTIYVDGSRSGVLVNVGESKDSEKNIVEAKCPKRPKELECDIHHIKVDGMDWVAFVGLLNGMPYEVFGGAKEQVDIPRKIKKGKILKRKCEKVNAKGRTACYDLIIGEDDDEWRIKDVAVSFENGNYAAQTRMISLSLRHGVPAQFIAEQLSRDLESDFHSFSRVMARVLKQYVSDGTTSGEKCSDCGEKLRFENGCAVCSNCGNSKCG